MTQHYQFRFKVNNIIKLNMNLVIIDYKLSNLYSVEHACQKLGYNPVVSSDAKDIDDADAIILPGVGAFSEAMHNLNKLDLKKFDELDQYILHKLFITFIRIN